MTLMAAGTDMEQCGSRLIQLEQKWTRRLGIGGGEQIVGVLLSCRGRSGDHDVLG